ncbi:hypothetical protein DSO57_1006183 [Entomophthora muscae]|uniref:Uncharacterized protein n=1 Tax=Entomophthora muscae TaxID=34485 RepID=A0ACC2RMK2_9FUNG|nr:hypothetical protein DSO57_1006183 [Entomophthora muscae]
MLFHYTCTQALRDPNFLVLGVCAFLWVLRSELGEEDHAVWGGELSQKHIMEKGSWEHKWDVLLGGAREQRPTT